MSNIEINLTIKSSKNSLKAVCKVSEAALPSLLAYVEENFQGDNTQEKLGMYWKAIIQSELSNINEINKAKAAQAVEEINLI